MKCGIDILAGIWPDMAAGLGDQKRGQEANREMVG